MVVEWGGVRVECEWVAERMVAGAIGEMREESETRDCAERGSLARPGGSSHVRRRSEWPGSRSRRPEARPARVARRIRGLPLCGSVVRVHGIVAAMSRSDLGIPSA